MDHAFHAMHDEHSGHGGMDMPGMEPMCNMNMLFTWDSTNLCIIFRSWHIYTNVQLILSLLAIVALTAGYEAVRELSRRYETRGENIGLDRHTIPAESSSLLQPGRSSGANGARQTKVVKAAFYAVQVFYSFFIMLLFMTYNGWVMLAVAVGAFVGYLAFGSKETSASKSAACH